LVGVRESLARPKDLTKLVRQGRLKIPDAVAREIRKKDDRLRDWVGRHGRDCVLDARDENIAELQRIARSYIRYLGEKPGAADPLVVCMAIYYKASGFITLTDDAGIQVVCLFEKVPYVTSSGFCRLEGL